MNIDKTTRSIIAGFDSRERSSYGKITREEWPGFKKRIDLAIAQSDKDPAKAQVLLAVREQVAAAITSKGEANFRGDFATSLKGKTVVYDGYKINLGEVVDKWMASLDTNRDFELSLEEIYRGWKPEFDAAVARFLNEGSPFMRSDEPTSEATGLGALKQAKTAVELKKVEGMKSSIRDSFNSLSQSLRNLPKSDT